jgi:hypothetical protein
MIKGDDHYFWACVYVCELVIGFNPSVTVQNKNLSFVIISSKNMIIEVFVDMIRAIWLS